MRPQPVPQLVATTSFKEISIWPDCSFLHTTLFFHLSLYCSLASGSLHRKKWHASGDEYCIVIILEWFGSLDKAWAFSYQNQVSISSIHKLRNVRANLMFFEKKNSLVYTTRLLCLLFELLSTAEARLSPIEAHGMNVLTDIYMPATNVYTHVYAD